MAVIGAHEEALFEGFDDCHSEPIEVIEGTIDVLPHIVFLDDKNLALVICLGECY